MTDPTSESVPPLASGRGAVYVDHRQFLVRVNEAVPLPPEDQAGKGLIAAAADGIGAMILTGTNYSTVTVSAEARDSPPATVAEGWEDVQEVSVVVPGPDDILEITALEGDYDLLVMLNKAEGTEYRVRAHANNRDQGRAGLDSEEYLIVAWPAPVAPPVVHKMTSKVWPMGDSEPKG